jgi:hypothetical protein
VRVFIVLALLGQASAPELMTPEQVWSRCLLDLNDNVEPADRPYTRYLYAPDDTWPYPQIASYAANSTSFRTEFGQVESLGGKILRLDLRAFGWDYPSRVKRLAELERRGVNFNLKDVSAHLALLNPWEQLARLDPYFEADRYDSSGQYRRGWINSDMVNAARGLSRSLKFVLRIDQVTPRMLTGKTLGGIYGDLLLFAPKEEDVFRGLLIDVKSINRDSQLRQGGAVLESIVALHNRGLEMLPTYYGHGGNKYHWQTYDEKEDATGNKSVLEAFAGTLDHDGRETIGSLPNGLQYYLLFDGKGDAVDVVPESIAQIKSPLVTPVHETRVINSYKCLECHTSGIIGFEDVVRKAFLSSAAQLKARAKSPYAASELATALAEYYTSDVPDTITAQQKAYTARLKQCCGMDGVELAKAVIGAVEDYQYSLVTQATAAREQGYPEDFARMTWLGASVPYSYGGYQYAGSPALAVLATGQPIRRASFEPAFGDAMRVAIDLKKRLGALPKPRPN